MADDGKPKAPGSYPNYIAISGTHPETTGVLISRAEYEALLRNQGPSKRSKRFAQLRTRMQDAEAEARALRAQIERALRFMGDTRAHEEEHRQGCSAAFAGGHHAPAMGTRYIDAEGVLRAALKEAGGG